MAFDADPYRTLGLARGASLDEVKRAYRRLAKAHHPDAAGSGALARFLAIQAAYEQLVEGPGGAAGGPRGPSSAARPGTARRASDADPDRADATRRAYGGRARARRPADEKPGRRQATGDSGARERSAERGDADTNEPGSTRRRDKATLGSTSYDDATVGAAEPDWSGASWYGTTSGTYWTINPREYADPRKHGPEYQARARRASGTRSAGRHDEGAPRPADPEPGPGADPDDRPPGSIHDAPSWWGSTSGPSEAATGPRPRPTTWRQAEEPSPLADERVPDPVRALSNLARALTDPRAGGLRGRAIRAVVGWLPIALGIGWLIGEITGCGRFAATCDPSVDPLILLIQGAALVALLLAPLLASLAAGAALGLLVAAVAATAVLSATGTAADEGSRRATLGLLLVVAWLAGLAIAIVQRVRAASSRVGPVS
ncbi:MAG: DnaJ domain-containing protein [Candidatus Limnocylindrales bacterium]